MFYSDEEKRLMGNYFKWQRVNIKIHIKEVVNQIHCSYKTYKDIENGLPKKNDDFYDGLQVFYSVHFHINYDLYESSISIIPKLYQCVEMLDRNQINTITNELKNKIIKLKQYAYYKELFETLEFIERNYVNQEYLTRDEIEYGIRLIDFWNNDLSSILYEICQKSNAHSYNDRSISDRLYCCAVKDVISKYCYAKECVAHNNYSESLDLFKELAEYFDYTNNQERNQYE